ncbi:MAG TPA: FxSxx-COOH system tetratricopeptide repeat protein [Pseudonocardiaceae bacterium]|nr:FxSxx-COOH system tetratricopeptide repeat protein [Pseudonocardiaceae bacterium]
MGQPPDNPTPDTTNRVTGSVSGIVVQSGAINGGVHVHQPGMRPTVTLPHRAGAVPLKAAAFQNRSTTGLLAEALDRGRTAVSTSDSTAHTSVVAGMGGVGKTQIAVDYAERSWAAGEVELLVWVTAGSREAILSAYAELAADLTGLADPDTQRCAMRLLELLAVIPARWLVVLDDVQNPADLRGLWPPGTPTGRTVVTTRRRDAALRGHGRQLVDVDVFTCAEAHAYLEAMLEDQPRLMDGAADLAGAVGYLPLALAQAVAYLRDRGLSCTAYRQRLVDRQRQLAEMVPEPDNLPDEHRATVAATWSLSVEQANQLPPLGIAGTLLEVASVLDANGIPTEVFTASAVIDLLAETTGRDIQVDDARDGLGCLRRLSLITWEPGVSARAVRVHALVQRTTLETQPPGRLHLVVDAAGDALQEVWPEIERDSEAGQVLRANADALANAGDEHLWIPDCHSVLFRAGRSLADVGLLAEARDYFYRLQTAAHIHLGPDHPDTLEARHELARLHGDPADAAIAYEQVLRDRTRVLGPDHPHTLTTNHQLAYFRDAAGDPASAAAIYEQVLCARIRVLGPDHHLTLLTRNNLAHCRGRTGDPAGAVTALERLLTDYLRVLGPDHPRVLANRHNLARWRGHAGDLASAVTELEQVLADDLGVLGPDHPQTLTTRSSLARWRGQAGDVAGAMNALDELLTDRIRVLGPHHPDSLATRDDLGYWQKQHRGSS